MQAVVPLQYSPAMRLRPSQAVYRRRRVAVLLCAAAVVVAITAWQGLHPRTGASGDGPLTVAGQPVRNIDATLVGSARIIVQPGDTLWTIARRVQPTGDVRPLVDRLSRERKGRPLQVGERIDLSLVG